MNHIKPIDADVHFKYICPSNECNTEHWLSIKEAKVENFKVLCDVCDTVFTPKRVKSITVNFLEEIKEPEVKEMDFTSKNDDSFLQEAIDALIRLGFNKTESKIMIMTEWKRTGERDPGKLVKLAFNLLGENNG
jgi:hypothetical protein